MKTRTFLTILVLGFVVSTSVGAVEFSFDNDAQGWTVGSSGSLEASAGTIIFTYSDPAPDPFDPILVSPAGLSIDTARQHWLVLELNITAAVGAGDQQFQIFFDNGESYNEPDSRTFPVTPNIGDQTVIFDMAPPQEDRDPWTGFVTSFRIDPGRSATDLLGYDCTFTRIAITDDTDMDGIRDDAEYDYWGNLDEADATTDHDGDGLLDSVEIALGLNPLFDEGATLPASSPWSLRVLLGVILLAGAGLTLRSVAARCY